MLRLIVLVVPLCLDTFAVSLALGTAGLTRRQRLQVSILFPLAEAGMPLLGLVAGAGLARAIGSAADYIAAVVVIAVGAFLLAEDEADEARRLARGFGIGLLRLSFVLACIMIAVQAVIASQLGLLLGKRVGRRARTNAGRLAGLLLVVIGIF